MIINVDNGSREPIDGVARAASIRLGAQVATVSVASADLIAPPRPNQDLTFSGVRWAVERTIARTAHALTFTCRRL